MPEKEIRLVTGGGGLLGRHIVEALLGKGERVRVYDLRKPADFPQGVEFVEGDIRDAQRVSEAMRGVDTAYHLAACMPQARLSKQGFRDINVGGTLNVLQGGKVHGLKKIVFASTIEIYGLQTEFPVREDASKLFTGEYSRNKWECEEILRGEKWLHRVMLRMPMIYGRGFYHEKSMIQMFDSIKRGWPVPLPGRVDIPYHVVAATDTADAFLLAAGVTGANGEAFNIGAPDTPMVGEFLNELFKLAGSRSKIIVIPLWIVWPWLKFFKVIGGIPVINTPAELIDFAFVGGAYDISKASKILGWNPGKTCAQSAYETYAWYVRESAKKHDK
jgi:nucleoside-diphosphate-sugar epimerase